jgi:hypothetical protein
MAAEEIARRKVEAGEAEALFGLTEAEIQALLPRDILRLAAHHAVRVGDLKLAREIAKDWAPYEHARKSETVTITPEDLKRVADTARREAARRGLDVELARLPVAGAVPN